MAAPKASLNDLFSTFQESMLADLNLTSHVSHPVAKGDLAELSWLDMLQEHLPKRYQAARAFVVDSRDDISDQQDIVIFDHHYSPFVFNQKDVLYIPAESVYAVFEVKPEITKGYIGYAGDKAESVRELHRTAAPIVQAGGNISSPKKPHDILSGILATRCQWRDPFGKTFAGHIDGLSGSRSLQLGCAASHGAFEVTSTSPLDIRVSTSNTAVMAFFLTLLRRLQQLGTVSAIDLSAYEKFV